MTSWHFWTHTSERVTDKTIYLPMKKMCGSLFSFKVTNESKRTYYDLYLNCKQCPDDRRCVCSAQAMHTRTSHTTIAHKHTTDWSARQKRKLLRTLIHLRGAYGKHMFNIHLVAILGLSRLGSNNNDTSNSVRSASLFLSLTFDSSIQKLNELKMKRKEFGSLW